MSDKERFWDYFLAVTIALNIGSCVGRLTPFNHRTEFESYMQKEIAPIVLKQTGQQTKPSELEISLTDLDGDTQDEAIIKVQGQEYLMKIDQEGKVKLVKYRIEKTPAVAAKVRIITEQESDYEIKK